MLLGGLNKNSGHQSGLRHLFLSLRFEFCSDHSYSLACSVGAFNQEAHYGEESQVRAPLFSDLFVRNVNHKIVKEWKGYQKQNAHEHDFNPVFFEPLH